MATKIEPMGWRVEVNQYGTSVLDEQGNSACTKSNAKLISAAPDMLAALQDLMAWADHMGGWEAPCWARARKAITKATL